MRLKITRDGSLLSVVTDQSITDTQADSVLAILRAPDLTYAEVLSFLAMRNTYPGANASDYDSPFGAGDSVEAFRG